MGDIIKYFSYYSRNPDQKRSAVLAAMNKMDYICDALEASGREVVIISASTNMDKQNAAAYCIDQITEKTCCINFACGPCNGRWRRYLNRCRIHWHILLELMKVKRDEKVIVYHSLGYMNLVNLAHKLKKFHLILECEEIYSDVIGNKELRAKEIRFMQSADSYILSSRLLSEIVNPCHKPEVVIHGTYGVEADRKCDIFSQVLQQSEESCIHCVYAGTMDPRKGGAVAAAAAEFLPENYHIHILGFGSEKQIQEMKERIADISSRAKARVTYDGLLSGEEYIRFIQSCDIGLSTQNPDAAFNATSFPSKVLSYLANGLRVVSIRIPAIEQSAVGNALYYYDTQTPEEIAKAILSVDMTQKYDSRQLVAQLSEKFKMELNALVDRC